VLARSDFELGKHRPVFAQQRGGAGFGGTVDGENIHPPMIVDKTG